MKKILVVLAILVIATTVYAGVANQINQQRTMFDSAQATLLSGTTGTTAAYTTNYVTFDYPMSSLGCDVLTSASATTGAVVTQFYVNQGTSTTIFDTTSAMTVTVTPSLTLQKMSTNWITGKPFRTVSAVITTPNGTTPVNISCSGVK